MNKPTPIDKENYILIGLTDCDEKREQRTKEALELWKKLIDTEGYKETRNVFGEAYFVLMEALNSYQNSGFMATAIMCRVAVETAFYDIASIKSASLRKVDSNFLLHVTEKDEFIMKLIRYKVKGEYEVFKQVLKEKGLIDEQIEGLANRIREKGNYVAHYPVRLEKKLLQLLEGKTDDRYFWYRRKDALELLNETVELLRYLIKRVYDRYK